MGAGLAYVGRRERARGDVFGVNIPPWRIIQRFMALDIDQIEKPIRKLRKLLKKMPAEPTQKQVHDLRTNSRRVEATLEATDPNQNGRKILKQIAKVRTKAGKVRDMDVLTAFAAGLPQDKDEESCSVRLLEHLGAMRQRKAKKLSKAAQELGPELRKRLKRSSRVFEKRIKHGRDGGRRTSAR